MWGESAIYTLRESVANLLSQNPFADGRQHDSDLNSLDYSGSTLVCRTTMSPCFSVNTFHIREGWKDCDGPGRSRLCFPPSFCVFFLQELWLPPVACLIGNTGNYPILYVNGFVCMCVSALMPFTCCSYVPCTLNFSINESPGCVKNLKWKEHLNKTLAYTAKSFIWCSFYCARVWVNKALYRSKLFNIMKWWMWMR